MKPILASILSTSALAASVAAFAHPLPRAASPLPNAVLTSSPAQVSVTFSETLVPAFSGLSVVDQAGKAADVGPAVVDPANAKELVAPVRAPLGPGTYTVSWRAVGADTHHVSGHYSFQVRP
jgi:methionine-rich copper-binding protein CopC